MNTEDLLEKYFEGETSADEERLLRQRFHEGEIPPHLAIYKPLFAYFDEEIQQKEAKETPRVTWTPRTTSQRRFRRIAVAAAASLLLLLTVNHWLNPLQSRACADNYVMINGRCYTDLHTVKAMAFEALQEVATPADEYLQPIDSNAEERDLVEQQFRELNRLFSDDD